MVWAQRVIIISGTCHYIWIGLKHLRLMIWVLRVIFANGSDRYIWYQTITSRKCVTSLDWARVWKTRWQTMSGIWMIRLARQVSHYLIMWFWVVCVFRLTRTSGLNGESLWHPNNLTSDKNKIMIEYIRDHGH